MVKYPFYNVNPNFVNVDNSNDPSILSDNKIPNGPHTIHTPYTSNILSAKASAIKGGKKYKSLYMKKYRKSKKSKTRKNKKSRKFKGGYSQYQNNLPLTPTYALSAKYISPSMSALANPPIYTRLSNCTNCVDNYNYNTNKGFPSKGH
uniref:Uncharacterized protein n=1 Tax=viral metagenome TaxID=1070528 RepID=A0A6C0H5J8_9ZZZZ